ncbi:MAG: hypothetical protein JKY34_02655 [Kordiimonadaceae bacterium]|nr:hypothetical protein [Kordiimonadaceae bacterium]
MTKSNQFLSMWWDNDPTPLNCGACNSPILGENGKALNGTKVECSSDAINSGMLICGCGQHTTERTFGTNA